MSSEHVHRTAPPYNHFTQIGDPVLRLCAAKVSPSRIQSKEINDIVNQMVEVLRHYDCVGVAAPQLGVPLRIIVMEFREDKQEQFTPEVYKERKMSHLPLTVFINPNIEIIGNKMHTHPEGCMSVRGFSAKVARYDRVRITGIGMRGTPAELELTGWNARIAQHEMDHLNGIVYIDRMDVSSFHCINWPLINESGGRAVISFDK